MNTVIEIEVKEKSKERRKGRMSIGKKHCIKISLQKIEVVMNYLIPLEFHRASNAEPQPFKLL